MPPVLVRSEAVGQAAPVRKASRNKRRYDVALSVPGAELRLPSLPAVRFSWRILSGLMSLALIGLLYYAMTGPVFQVEGIQVEGLQRLTIEDIEIVAGMQGESIFLVDPGEVQGYLAESFKDLSHVKVQVGLPAEVIVTVTERIPVLAWFEDGREVWLDADGFQFDPRGDPGVLMQVEGKLPSSPVFQEGEAPENIVDPELISAVLLMSERRPRETRVVYDPAYGLGWYDERGWDVYFGMDNEQMEMKLQVYEALVEQLERNGVQPELVSVEYLHAPYYRVER